MQVPLSARFLLGWPFHTPPRHALRRGPCSLRVNSNRSGSDGMGRRLGIFYNAPAPAKESGKTAKANNPYFSLLPEIEVQGIRKFLMSS